MFKDSSSQTGSAHVIIIVVLVVALIGALGFVFWQNFIQNDVNTSDNETQSKKTNNDQAFDTSVHTISPIMMQSETDISKLPDYTPSSFRTYISTLLKQNKPPGADCDTAAPAYVVSKISQVNIRGGVGATAQGDQNCPGGAPVVWVLTPSGKWDEASLNGPMCKSENGGLIYEEFMPECYVESSTGSLVKNPNGSITSLNK
jgi:hypothetical protein